MKVLIDAQLPPALAGWLRLRGCDAVHVVDLGGPAMDDAAVWARATAESRAILTKDRDFAVWATTRVGGPQVIWLRLGNATERRLTEWLEPRWPEIVARLGEGGRLVEVGRP